MEKRLYMGLLVFNFTFMYTFIMVGYILVVKSPYKVEQRFFPAPKQYYDTVFAGYISFLYAMFFGVFSLIVVILHQIKRSPKKDDSNK